MFWPAEGLSASQERLFLMELVNCLHFCRLSLEILQQCPWLNEARFVFQSQNIIRSDSIPIHTFLSNSWKRMLLYFTYTLFLTRHGMQTGLQTAAANWWWLVLSHECTISPPSSVHTDGKPQQLTFNCCSLCAFLSPVRSTNTVTCVLKLFSLNPFDGTADLFACQFRPYVGYSLSPV